MVPEPKRNSGRTGRRRLGPAELAIRDRKAAGDHRRRYGPTTSMVSDKLPPPPSWFGPELAEIWREIVATSPPGILTAADHPAVVAYAVAVREHDRLAQRIARRKTPTTAPLSRQLRLLAQEVRAAATHLGLSIYQRIRIALPPPPPELPDNPHLRSVTLVEAGRVRGVYRVGRK